MSLLRKMLAAGFAAGVALTAPVAAPASHATPAPAGPVVVMPAEALPNSADAAAAYIIGQLTDETTGRSLGTNPGNTADAVVLLSAAGRADEAADLVAWLETRESVTTEPVLAAKMAYALHVGGGDAEVIDALLTKTIDGMKEDGSVGWASAFTQSWPIIALSATGREVPQPMLDSLMSHLGDGGMFGYLSWGSDEWNDDSDGTAMALWALTEVRASQCELDLTRVDAELPTILTAIRSARTDAGYWTSYSPVNSTGLMAFAQLRAGGDAADAVVWLEAQQQADGGLPSTLNGTSSNVMATLQGGLALAPVETAPVAPCNAPAPSEGAPIGDDPVTDGDPEEIPADTSGDIGTGTGGTTAPDTTTDATPQDGTTGTTGADTPGTDTGSGTGVPAAGGAKPSGLPATGSPR